MPRPGRKSKGKGSGKTAPTLTLSDELQAEATRAAAEAIGNWLQASILEHNNDRMIRTLRIEDLENIACAAICGWVQERAKQAHKLGEADKLGELISQVPPLVAP